MWKLKKIHDVDYFLNIEIQQNNELYKFCLTDFRKLWIVEIPSSEIVEQCKDINKWLEAENETLLTETLRLFEVDRPDVHWNLSAERLILESTFAGIKFSFHVDFQVANEEMFSKMVISPLLLIIKDLQHQKEYLSSCLRKKDIEIAEYRLDGAVISRKNVETTTFHEEMIPNLLSEDDNFVLDTPANLIDDKIISSYNEIYSFMSRKTAKVNHLIKEESRDGHNEEDNREIVKVPKKNESNLEIRTENEDNGSTIIPVPVPIRKKPQPRKLKNL